MKMGRNGNYLQNWEWEGMENNLYGNGNGPYSHGNKFHRRMPCLTYVLARKRKILFFVKVKYNSAYNLCNNNNNNNLTCKAPVCAKKDFSGAGGQN